MAEDQESTTSVIDLPLAGDHGNDLNPETLIFSRESIASSLSSASAILPQDLMTIQSLDSHSISTASSFTVGGVAVSSNAGTTASLQGEIAMSQSDGLAVTEYQLVDSGNGELIVVSSTGQKGIELAGVQAGSDQEQAITLSIDQATQLYLQQQGLNRTIQMPDGSLQVLNPSLVQVEKEDGTIEAQELSLEVLQALQGEYIQQMPSLSASYSLVESSEADEEVSHAKPDAPVETDESVMKDDDPVPSLKSELRPVGVEKDPEKCLNEKHVSDHSSSQKGNGDEEINEEDKEMDEETEADGVDMEMSSQLKANKEDVAKEPDLTSPIPLTDQTVVMIKGKKCVLAFNEDTHQVCAYPIKPTPGTRKRGRPKLSIEEKEKMAEKKRQLKEINPAMDELVAPSEKSTAAETLLELSSVGADGVRRSARKRRKAKLFEEYEELEDSDEAEPFVDNQDKDPDITLTLPDVKKKKIFIREESSISILPTPPLKRGRGRPRRYPPPGQTQTPTSIPAVIIPSANGQTIVMAPIAGLQNLPNFQRQLPNLVPKPQVDITTGTASIPSETTDTTTLSLGGEPDPLPLDTSEALDSNSMIPTALQGDTVPLVGNEAENMDNSDHVDTMDNSGNLLNFTPQRADKSKEEGTQQNTDQLAQSAVIQIPDNLLPMLGIKRDPIKIGLKASERELEKLKCPKCDFQCFYNQQYRTHIATHGDDIHKCKCCSYVSLDSNELLTHFKEFHPRCICPECDFMAEHAYIIKRHMMRHNAKSCTCHVCGKVYKDMYILKMHVKMVHMPPEVLFECNVCSKKFTRKAHLKRHLRIHEPEKPFKCPHCDYRGCERSDISKHMLIHEEPKHVCERCGKTFRHIKNKELHVKRHYGQRDYKCGVCEFFGYTFTDIRKHIERKHQDMKMLICDKCNKHFKSEFSLKEHQQVCNVMMIEQILAIPTSAGGTSQATIQIPTVVGPDGQRIILDGHNIAVDGQAISVDGQSISLEKSGDVNIMVSDQPLDLPGGSVGVVEDEELEDEDGSINQAMHIISQTILTETGEELHIIETPSESLVAGEDQDSQKVVLLHQGMNDDSQLSRESSHHHIDQEYIRQDIKEEEEQQIQGEESIAITTSEGCGNMKLEEEEERLAGEVKLVEESSLQQS